MSSGVEGTRGLDATEPTPHRRTDQRTDPRSAEIPHDHHHHVLIEPEEDRWRWRRRIRQNPRQLAVYRFGVGVAGLFFICLGLVTGPLPGPGGIPLVLLGLAVWSSEFEWAHKVMMWSKAQMVRFRGWPRRRKVVFWLLFFLICGSFGYTYLLLIGPPTWMPEVVHQAVALLPGV